MFGNLMTPRCMGLQLSNVMNATKAHFHCIHPSVAGKGMMMNPSKDALLEFSFSLKGGLSAKGACNKSHNEQPPPPKGADHHRCLPSGSSQLGNGPGWGASSAFEVQEVNNVFELRLWLEAFLVLLCVCVYIYTHIYIVGVYLVSSLNWTPKFDWSVI